jgi:hypothetical protein
MWGKNYDNRNWRFPIFRQTHIVWSTQHTWRGHKFVAIQGLCGPRIRCSSSSRPCLRSPGTYWFQTKGLVKDLVQSQKPLGLLLLPTGFAKNVDRISIIFHPLLENREVSPWQIANLLGMSPFFRHTQHQHVPPCCSWDCPWPKRRLVLCPAKAASSDGQEVHPNPDLCQLFLVFPTFLT